MNFPCKPIRLALALTVTLNTVPVLAEQGTPIMEVVNLKALAQDKAYEFVFIGGSLKLRSVDGAPMRPIALPLRKSLGGAQ